MNMSMKGIIQGSKMTAGSQAILLREFLHRPVPGIGAGAEKDCPSQKREGSEIWVNTCAGLGLPAGGPDRHKGFKE